MRTICCIICNKCRKFKYPKISQIFEKKLVLSIICSKCQNEDETIFEKEESFEILKILSLTKNNKIKRVCTTLNYIECFLTLVFPVTGCISISVFATLADIPTEITNCTKGLDICAIIAGIKHISQ